MSKEKTIPTVTREELVKMSLSERLSLLKAELATREIPKSGENKFAGYRYHELQDFLPIVNELNAKYGIDDTVYFDKENGQVIIELRSTHNEDKVKRVSLPYVEAEMLAKGGAPSTIDAIQRMGSTVTYNRRYIYMLAYNITESDAVDSSDSEQRTVNAFVKPRPLQATQTTSEPRPAPTTDTAKPRPLFQQTTPASTLQNDKASIAQVNLIKKFVSENKLPEDTKVEGVTKQEASNLITQASSAPKTPSPLED